LFPTTMTTIPTDILRNVLEKIEEMNLPEGQYLTLANLLNTHHKKDEQVFTIQIPNKVQFIGKKTLTIETHMKYSYYGERPWEIEYSVNGVHKRKIGVCFIRCMNVLYMGNLTRKILLGEEQCEITLGEFVSQVRETDEALGDDEEADGPLHPSYVMGQLFNIG